MSGEMIRAGLAIGILIGMGIVFRWTFITARSALGEWREVNRLFLDLEESLGQLDDAFDELEALASAPPKGIGQGDGRT